MPDTGRRVNVVPATGVLADASGAECIPKFATFSTSSATTNVAVVNAVTGKKIRVLAASINGDGDTDVHFRSGSTQITGTRYLPSSGAGSGWSYCPLGRFETTAGAALNVYQTAAVAIAGEITYVEVD